MNETAMIINQTAAALKAENDRHQTGYRITERDEKGRVTAYQYISVHPIDARWRGYWLAEDKDWPDPVWMETWQDGDLFVAEFSIFWEAE